MFTLGIDTSNYATSLAVYDATAKEVVCDKKRFLPVKPGQLGLRQSDALFHHTVALPELLSELASEVDLSKIAAVGVSARPRPINGSYMPCFLAGINLAVAFGTAKNIPVLKSSHQQGHIAAALLATKQEAFFHEPCLVFHVSGGTTDLLLCNGYKEITCVGTSNDLYAGQAVDRIGVKLGFQFPAGPTVSEFAAKCSEPMKPKVSISGTNCNLSGLENQCIRLLEQGKSAEYVCRYCLLYIAETAIKMIKIAQVQHPNLPIVFAGGVMSSDIIRQYVTQKLSNVYFVPAKFSSDNAIGIARIAAEEAFNG